MLIWQNNRGRFGGNCSVLLCFSRQNRTTAVMKSKQLWLPKEDIVNTRLQEKGAHKLEILTAEGEPVFFGNVASGGLNMFQQTAQHE